MSKKKNKIRLTGTVKDGKLKYDSPAGRFMLEEFFSQQEGQNVEIELKVIKDMVSYQQHKFYRGAILPAFRKATGETNSENLHRYLKGKYLVQLLEGPNGGVAPFIPSTGDLDKYEMAAYIEDILNELADCGGSLDKDEVIAYQASTKEAIK